MEVQARDRALMLVQRPHVLLRIEVEDANGVVGSAGGHNSTTAGDTLDGADVRRISKLPLQLLFLQLHVIAP